MQSYRVRLRSNEVEIEVESSDREYVESKLRELEKFLVSKAVASTSGESAAGRPRRCRSIGGKAVSISDTALSG